MYDLAPDDRLPPPATEPSPAPGQSARYITVFQSSMQQGIRLHSIEEHLVDRNRIVFIPTRRAMARARSYARYVCRTRSAAQIELFRFTRLPIPPDYLLTSDRLQPGNLESLRDSFTDFGVSFGKRRGDPAWFKVTESALDSLRRVGVPEAILSKLKSLKDREFETRDKLSRELESVLTKEELKRWRELVLNRTGKPELLHLWLRHGPGLLFRPLAAGTGNDGNGRLG